MTNPSWTDAPEWAQWLAMDGSGDWYWYEDNTSVMLAGHWRGSLRVEYAGDSSSWQSTLEHRPECAE